jgi:hypothetical protein
MWVAMLILRIDAPEDAVALRDGRSARFYVPTRACPSKFRKELMLPIWPPVGRIGRTIPALGQEDEIRLSGSNTTGSMLLATPHTPRNLGRCSKEDR